MRREERKRGGLEDNKKKRKERKEEEVGEIRVRNQLRGEAVNRDRDRPRQKYKIYLTNKPKQPETQQLVWIKTGNLLCI